MRNPAYRNLTLDQLVARLNAGAFIADQPTQESDMPRTVKKFEHVQATTRNQNSKYDWDLILSGQNVVLDAGTDYDQFGEHTKDGDGHKKGDKYDRTANVEATIKFAADERDKAVEITRIDSNGKPVSDQKQPGTGLVVTARGLTAEELKSRNERRERMRQAREAAKAAKGDGANGHQTHDSTPQVAAVEPEPMA